MSKMPHCSKPLSLRRLSFQGFKGTSYSRLKTRNKFTLTLMLQKGRAEVQSTMGYCTASSVHCATTAEEITARVWTWVCIGVWLCVYPRLHTLLLNRTSVKVLSHSFCTQMNIIWMHIYIEFIFHWNHPFLYTTRSQSQIEDLVFHQGRIWAKIPGGHNVWIRTYWANSEWKK